MAGLLAIIGAVKMQMVLELQMLVWMMQLKEAVMLVVQGNDGGDAAQ